MIFLCRAFGCAIFAASKGAPSPLTEFSLQVPNIRLYGFDPWAQKKSMAEKVSNMLCLP